MIGFYSELRGFILAIAAATVLGVAICTRSRRMGTGCSSRAAAASSSSGGCCRRMPTKTCSARRCWRTRTEAAVLYSWARESMAGAIVAEQHRVGQLGLRLPAVFPDAVTVGG